METPLSLLSPIQTRGDFRKLNSQDKNTRSSSLPPEHPIWGAWLILMDKYGAQWTQGGEPSMGWVHSLRDMTKFELEKGIDNLVHRDDNHWPPNAEEFASLCRNSYTWQTQCHKIFKPENKLENLTAKEKNNKIGQDTFKNIRDMFQ
jgi:hypothetical protein